MANARLFLGIWVAGSVCGAAACEESVEQACEELAAVECAREASCSPFRLQTSYGSAEACAARARARCTRLPALDGARVTVRDIEACTSAHRTSQCDNLLLDAPPRECRFAGERTNGASCAAGAQCASSFCDTRAEGACGQCKAVRVEGESCSKGGSPCDAGLYCGDSQCRKLGRQGDVCGGAAPCGPRLACKSGLCVAPSGSGEPCDQGQLCDPLLGLACNPLTGSCEEQPIAAIGEACGMEGAAGLIPVCAGGAWCSGDQTCSARGDIGEACKSLDVTGGNDCLSGLMCVEGLCSADYPAACN